MDEIKGASADGGGVLLSEIERACQQRRVIYRCELEASGGHVCAEILPEMAGLGAGDAAFQHGALKSIGNFDPMPVSQ